jgi:hypothetical protein
MAARFLARTPSAAALSKRTVGHAKACPSPLSQDSKVSTPFASRVITISRMPSSSGGSKIDSFGRRSFSGSGLNGVLVGQSSHGTPF